MEELLMHSPDEILPCGHINTILQLQLMTTDMHDPISPHSHYRCISNAPNPQLTFVFYKFINLITYTCETISYALYYKQDSISVKF